MFGKSIFIVTICCVFPANSQTVNTTNGKVTGLRKTILGKQIDVFYGLPFAKPPVGLLRFKRPVPVDPWTPKVLNASKSKPSCFQDIHSQSSPLERIPPEVSEDCLYMNVFAPVSSQTPLAVMVWIYGGAFITGSINSPMFDGKILASLNDVVVVTINYRLGVLGFLYLDSDTVPGNMGLLDQQLAIKWVHENIHNFGGDTSRITIFGESAGAGSVSHHLLSPLSQPYFTSGIMESGSPLTSWDLLTAKQAKTFAIAIANKAKCSSVRTNADIYECLDQKSAEDLVRLQDHLAPGANVAFAPVVDGFFLPDRPLAILEAKQMKNCSILLGVNQNEGSLFLYLGHPSVFKPTDNLTITDDQFMADLNAQARNQGGGTLTVNALYQEYVLSHIPSDRDYVRIADEILGDYLFKCPATRFSGFYATESPVYLYSFNHRLSSSVSPKWMGVKHGAELPFVWGHALDPDSPVTFTPDEKDLSRKMMTCWTNFAKFGSPNGGSTSVSEWPQFDNTDEKYMELDTGSNLKMSQGLRRRQCVFLYQTVPLVASLENGQRKPGSTPEPCDQTVGGVGSVRPSTVVNLIITVLTLVVWTVGQ